MKYLEISHKCIDAAAHTLLRLHLTSGVIISRWQYSRMGIQAFQVEQPRTS